MCSNVWAAVAGARGNLSGIRLRIPALVDTFTLLVQPQRVAPNSFPVSSSAAPERCGRRHLRRRLHAMFAVQLPRLATNTPRQ